MALETKQVGLCIKKVLRSSIRTSYRCVSEHPVLFSLGVLLYLLYRSAPGFFAFLLSSSPVIICTTLLLGILLSYGDTNLPEANDEDTKTTPEIPAFKMENSSRDVQFGSDQRISVPSFRNTTENFKERETKRTGSVRERSTQLDDEVPLLRRVDEEDERFEHGDKPKTLTPFPSMVNFRGEAGIREGLNFNQGMQFADSFFVTDMADRNASLFEGLDEKNAPLDMFSSSENFNKHAEMQENLNLAASKVSDFSEEKLTDGTAGTSRPTYAVSVRQNKKLDVLKVNTSKAVEENLLDSSLGSPWASVGSQDGSSGFDSDGAESSSPDASMTDIAPVLDEIDPLLGADFTRPDPIPNDDSDSDSHVSSQDHEMDDDSNDDDDDGNNDTKDGGEENKKDEGQEAAFIWTADDAKNLMDLGYSEMERNRRLEILMVRRRSRKNIIFDIDSNLTDANGKSGDDLSRFGAQVSHISVTRRNPFDLPYDSDEAAIPGSAPSILHARKNPFDFLEHSSESGVSAHDNLSPGESPQTSHREIFRRHESFNFGTTDATQERRLSRLRPYFVPETVEGSTSTFQRQFSDKSESKLSSVTESDMASSVADQEEHKDLDEKDVHREHESPALLRQDSDLADAGSECSDGINSVDVELDNSDIDEREIALHHFVFERSEEREAYLVSTKGKGHDDNYMLKSDGNSTVPLHPVGDLLSWDDGDGESVLGAKSSIAPNITAEVSEWLSSPRPAEDHELRSRDLGLGATSIAEEDGNVDSMSCPSNEIPLQNLIHGPQDLLTDFEKETLPAISMDLHPIPEERVLENFNMEEKHETGAFTGSGTAMTDLHVIEEHFDVASEVSPSSVVASLCPPGASGSNQSPSIEPKDVSNPFFSVASEPDRVDMVDMNEEMTSDYLLDSDDDDADRIYPEPLEDNGIDESFLSELDAVGDFRIEPVRLDQQVPDLSSRTYNPADGVAEDSLISPKTSGDTATSDACALDSGGLSPLVDYLSGTDPEFSWSLGSSHDDPEQTVYNPRRRILEAMNRDLNLPCDEPEVTEMPSVNTPSEAYLVVGTTELEVTKNEPGTAKTDAEMMAVDAKSLEDIEMAFKQASGGGVDEAETAHISGVDIDLEPLEGSEELHVIDAKSVEDISAALKEHSNVNVSNCFEQSEDEVGCGEVAECAKHDSLPEGTHVESLQKHLPCHEPEVTETPSVNTLSEAYLAVGATELEVTKNELGTAKTDAEMMAVDAKSLEDIEMAFKQASAGGVDGPILDAETALISGVDIDSEPLEGSGQLHVIDAKSVEDISAVPKEHSSVDVNNYFEQNEDKVGYAEAVERPRHDSLPEGAHVESLHLAGDDGEPESNMSCIEAKTIDDMNAVFKKLSDGHEKSTVKAMEPEDDRDGRDASEQH
ncbi:hypothetical protein CFC21_101271 [Triticum aestivum]|uniref:Ulp1 protease family C-terminal catalytic domain containing protein expressed n=2 Tax=Triticum aestivum TaxID=4565 RepID=A0A3B6SC51_WHEAT|nr:uncharacterized protein LOC123161641 [Triticum aestivum]XP_044435388.1 uncharacterized protein LOC123161641 [Triticum aestivum]KAF7099665.1 hypothetical protein CFC21_101271 [Triticum aestivum]